MKKLALALIASSAICLVGCATGKSNAGTATGNAHDIAEGLEYSHLSNQNIRAMYSTLTEYVAAARTGNTDRTAALQKSLAQSATRYRKALDDAQFDESAYRRGIANAMLGFTGDPKVAYSIAAVAGNPEEVTAVRSRATFGLAAMGQRLNESDRRKDIVDTILTMMLPAEEDMDVRLNAVSAYSAAFNKSLGDEITPLLNVLNDDVSDVVREQALFGLGQIADPASVIDIASISTKDDEARIRAAAANALGKIRSPLSLEALRAIVQQDGSGLVRAEATFALSGQLGVADDRDVIDLVIAGTGDVDEHVRESAARAASKVGSTDAIRPLMVLTRDRSTQVRIAAIESIGDITPREQEVEAIQLINSLTDGDPYVKRAAQRSLQRITGQNFGSSTESWTDYYYSKYPDRSMENYKGPIPPVSQGASTGATPRTRTPRTASTRNTRSSTRNTRSNTQRTRSNFSSSRR